MIVVLRCGVPSLLLALSFLRGESTLAVRQLNDGLTVFTLNRQLVDAGRGDQLGAAIETLEI